MDSVLIKNYISGDEKSLEILIKKYKNRVFSFIYSKVLDKDVAEDIFQDTFIKVILTLKSRKYNDEGKFLPWVMRIAHNLAIDYFRLNKKSQIVRESNNYDNECSLFDLYVYTMNVQKLF